MWVKRNDQVIQERVLAGALTSEEAAQLPTRVPAVLPAHPCPSCGAFDWFGDLGDGMVARREDFQRDAAEAIAVETRRDNLAVDMRIRHDIQGGQMGYARTGV